MTLPLLSPCAAPEMDSSIFHCLASAATGHAVILGLGYLWCRRQSLAEVKAPMDERDRAIEYRGTRAAYFVLMELQIMQCLFAPYMQTHKS